MTPEKQSLERGEELAEELINGALVLVVSTMMQELGWKKRQCFAVASPCLLRHAACLAAIASDRQVESAKEMYERFSVAYWEICGAK